MRPSAPPVTHVAVKEPATVKILVAANHIGPGEFLKPELFDWKDWPKDALDDRFIVKEGFKETDVVGAVAKQPLEQGDPIFTSKIIKPGQGGFLAAVLKPGMRAVSVNVNRATGNAGLILPGDLVDLVLTGKVDSQNSEQQTDHYVGQTVLHKLRVLAIDQTLDTKAQNKDQPQVAQTTTLEVTPKDAEKVLVAEQLGQLSLVLRSLAVADGQDGKPVVEDDKPALTWDRDVSLALKQRGGARRTGGAPAPRPGVVVMRGNARSTVSFTPQSGSPSAPAIAASALSPDASAVMPGQ